MTDQEATMYQIIGAICEANAPIVFKGALITKLILAEHDYTVLERKTRDIDANWIGTPPPMGEIENTINHALKGLNGRFHAEAHREYGERMSAGLYIIENATGENVVSMDIDVRPICGSRVYHYGEVAIKGVLVNEILADKITVMSGMKLFRRLKDFVDVYALTHCVKVKTTDIYEVISNKCLELGEFTELFTRCNDVEHAYDMLKGVERKPPFEDVYPYITAFVRPFAQRNTTPRAWNSDKQAWDDLTRMVDPRSSVLDQLREAEQEAPDRPTYPPEKTKHIDELER